MTNTIGGATIELGVDSSGVESGLDRVDGAVRRTGRTLDSLRTQGGGALDSIGAGGSAAANRVDAATRNIAGAVERANAALVSGKKSGAEYFEELGRSRGADMLKLAPLIAQLRETEAAQARAKAAIDATTASQLTAAEAARAQASALRDVASAQAGRDSYVASLREQVALYGKSTEEVLRYKAAQAGAAEVAGPLILQLQNMRAAHEAITESTRLEAQAQRQVAQAQANKDSFLATLREQAALHGKSAEEVLRYRAALAGASADAEPMIQALTRMKAAQEAATTAAKAASDAQNAAAQAQAKGDAFLANLREQVALYGKSTDEVLRYKAAQAGAATAAEPQIQELQRLKAAQDAVTESARLATAAQQQAAQVQSNRDTLLAGLREQIALYGKSTEEVLRYRAAQAGAVGAAEPLIQELSRLKIAQDAVTEAAKLAAAAQQQASQQQAAGAAMLTSLRDQIALYGKTTEEVMRYKAAQAGVAGAAEPHIQELARLKLAEDAVTASAKAAAEAQRAAATAQTGRDSFVAGLQQQAAAIGKTRADLLELQAAQMGVTSQAAPFIAKLREVEQGLNHAGMSARATAAAMRGVPAQFTDIVTSIQGGQAPLTVLLQQGGQLKDMFGGLGNAAKALGGYIVGLINPYTIAAAAAAVLAVAFVQGRNEAIAYNKALILAGATATTTSGQLSDMARSISKGVGTQGAAAEAVLAMVATGKVTADNLEQFSTVAIKAQRALGQSVTDTAAQFADLGKAPVATLLKLDETFHFLTAGVYEQVKALELQGRTVEAGTAAQQAWAAALGGASTKVAENLGSLQKAWKWVGDEAKGAWDSMLNIGREQTLEQQLATVQKRLTSSAGAASGKLPNGLSAGAETRSAAYAAQRAADLEVEASLKRQIALETAAIAPKEAANKLREAGKAWALENEKYLTRVQLREQELDKTRNQGAAFVAAGVMKQSVLDDRLGAVRLKYADTYNLAIDAQIELLKRRGAVEDESAKRSTITLNADRAAGLATSLLAEFEYADASAKRDGEALARKRALLVAELALTAAKPNSKKEQAALSGAIAEVDAQALARTLQLKEDIRVLDIKDTKQAMANLADLAAARATDLQSLQSQLQAQKDANAVIGLSAAEVNKLNQSLTEEVATRLENQASIIGGSAARAAEAADMRASAVAMRELAAERARGVDLGIVAKGKDDLKDFLDPSKAESFGQALRDAFGGATDAISKMTSSLRDFGKISKETETRRGQAANSYLNGLSTEAKYTKDLIEIDKKQASDKLGNYGDMAGAAASFFDKQSTGYKVLNGVSQAFHVAQLAMNLASIGPAIAAGAAQMFAQSGWGGFAGVAAMIGVMAALGAATSGGGGGPSAKQRQETQGTGSVFGDSSAKSDSIARSIELAATNSSIELTHTAGMLASLKAIENSISGLGNLLVRGSGLTGNVAGDVKGSAQQTFDSVFGPGSLGEKITGGLVGKIVGSIFGGKVSTLDTGVTANAASLASIAAGGLSAQQYTDTKKSGGWFSSDKYNTSTSNLGAEANDQFAKVILSLSASVKTAADLLGVGGDAFTTKLNSFVVDIGKISLKDLKGDEIQEALEAVFSKLGDDMAQFGVAGLEQFQQVGEGYFETLTRVATNYANLNSIMESIGTTFGATGMSSIAAREHLIELAGGIDELASQTSSFASNFLTQAEQLAPVQKYVTDQLAAMGLQSLTTRDQFKDYVLGLANSGALATDAGAQQYTALLALADAFAKTHAATEDLTKSEQEIADERKDLRTQLDELTMTQAQLAEKARAAIAPYNLALYDQVQALDLAKTSREMEITLMGLQGDKARVLAANRSDELKSMEATLRPLQELIYAQQDFAAAAAEASTLLGLQAQLYGATGDKAGAAAVLEAQHQAALVGLTPALAAATSATWAAQAAQKVVADATTEHNAVLTQLASLYAATGDKVAAAAVLEQQHQAALVGLTPALAAATQASWDAQAAEKMRADALAESNSLLSIQAQIYELTKDKAGAAAVLQQQHIAALVGLSPALVEATKALWSTQAAASATKDALADVSTAYSNVQAAVAVEKELRNAEYQKAVDATTASIDRLKDSVTKMKSLSDALHSALDAMEIPGNEKNDRLAAQAQIEAALAIARAGGGLPDADSLKSALKALAKDPSDQFASYADYMSDQYRTANTLKGLASISDTQLSTDQKMLELMEQQKVDLEASHKSDIDRLDATLTEAKNQSDLLNGIYSSLLTLPQALSAMAATIGKAQTNPAVAATTGIAGLYQSLLGRTPDADGLAFYQAQIAKGDSIDKISSYIKSSPEYKALHPFALGTNYVPGDMPALIHEGERIIPAADNRALMSRLSNPGGDNSELLAEMRAQRAENAELRLMLESHLYAIAKNTLNTADSLDGAINGETPIATKEVEAA